MVNTVQHAPDTLLYMVFYTAPESAKYDIVGTMLFVTVLLAVDIYLRFLIELINYNKAVGRPITTSNMIRALWYGWGAVKLPSGNRKRFLVSKNFRNALVVKAGLEYPLLFTLAAAAYALPDMMFIGYRVDVVFSNVLCMIPVMCEVASIVEKLNEVDTETIQWLDRTIKYIRGLK